MQQNVMTSTTNEDTEEDTTHEDTTYIRYTVAWKCLLNMKVSDAISLFQILFLPVLCFYFAVKLVLSYTNK